MVSFRRSGHKCSFSRKHVRLNCSAFHSSRGYIFKGIQAIASNFSPSIEHSPIMSFMALSQIALQKWWSKWSQMCSIHVPLLTGIYMYTCTYTCSCIYTYSTCIYTYSTCINSWVTDVTAQPTSGPQLHLPETMRTTVHAHTQVSSISTCACKHTKLLTSVLGGEMQNWMSPIFAFSTRVTPPARWEAFWSRTSPSTSSVSSTVPLGGGRTGETDTGRVGGKTRMDALAGNYQSSSAMRRCWTTALWYFQLYTIPSSMHTHFHSPQLLHNLNVPKVHIGVFVWVDHPGHCVHRNGSQLTGVLRHHLHKRKHTSRYTCMFILMLW